MNSEVNNYFHSENQFDRESKTNSSLIWCKHFLIEENHEECLFVTGNNTDIKYSLIIRSCSS